MDNLTGRQLPLDLSVIGDADSLMSNFTTVPEDTLGFDGDPHIVSVGEEPRPGTFWLGPCRPNPFNDSTIVPFQLEQPGRVDLSVHDLQGRLVLTVLRGRPMTASRHEVQISAERLPSGVYMYRLRAGQQERTGKMLLVK